MVTLPAFPGPRKTQGNAQGKARIRANRRKKASPVKGRLGLAWLGLAQKGEAEAVQKEGPANDKPQSRCYKVALFHRRTSPATKEACLTSHFALSRSPKRRQARKASASSLRARAPPPLPTKAPQASLSKALHISRGSVRQRAR